MAKRLVNGNLVIENLWAVGKIKVEHVRTTIEPDLVYPLLRGRDVGRWKASPSAYIILAQDPKTMAGVPEKNMKRDYPKTYAYFKRFEAELRQRSGYRQYFRSTGPFYSMYNVGPYSLSPWKVSWPEVGNAVRAGVSGPQGKTEKRPCLPDQTIIAVSADRPSEAYFVSALLNSSPAQSASSDYIVLHPSPHILEHIAIPRFSEDREVHTRLAELSQRCHAAAAKEDFETITALEVEVDKAAAKLWGITDDELKAIQEALAETGKYEREADASEADDQ